MTGCPLILGKGAGAGALGVVSRAAPMWDLDPLRGGTEVMLDIMERY